MDITEFFQTIKSGVTVVHGIAVVLGMGGALVSDMLFSFFSSDKKLNKTEISTLSVLAKVVLYSLILIAVSGIAIFLSDVEKYSGSSKFLAKMTILAVLLINGYLLNKYIWPHLLNKDFFVSLKDRNIRRFAFACGAVSVISWISVCTLGILNALHMSYGFILGLYVIIIFFGVTISIYVEKRELN
jgi:hypothetical protein